MWLSESGWWRSGGCRICRGFTFPRGTQGRWGASCGGNGWVIWRCIFATCCLAPSASRYWSWRAFCWRPFLLSNRVATGLVAGRCFSWQRYASEPTICSCFETRFFAGSLLRPKRVDAQESLVAGHLQLEFHRSTQICEWLGGKIGGGLKLEFHRYRLAILLNGESPEIQIQHGIGSIEIEPSRCDRAELFH